MDDILAIQGITIADIGIINELQKSIKANIALDKYDKNIVINALNNLRNRQIQEERPTEPVDELIDKVANAPTRKVKVVPCRCNEER